MTEALGLEAGVVRLAEYDERWPSIFTAEAQRILTFTEGWTLRLEHIGSTAIAGMSAKPVLDIAAGRPSGAALSPYITCFERAGYAYRGNRGLAGREFFCRGEPRAYHVHLVEDSSSLWREYLAFRNYLRAHTDAAARYARLKRLLAARFPLDRDAYIEGKATFVRNTVRRAIDESWG